MGPPAAHGSPEIPSSRRLFVRSAVDLRIGNGQEGHGCPATAALDLVRSLEASEAAQNERIITDRMQTAGGMVSRTLPGFAGEDPLEVALSAIADHQPNTGVAPLPSQEFAAGLHHLEVVPGPGVPQAAFGALRSRPYLLYVPEGYRAEEPIPLWIQGPGTDVAMETVMAHNAFFADRCVVAMVVLSGLGRKMSVDRGARAAPSPWPDDVAYVRALLASVFARLNVDRSRVRCMGFSRGGRFCARLASELSGAITGIAAVGAIRYPEPNNATRPVPVVAVHGVLDNVNPFHGDGPQYWGESVLDVIHKWADFNGCKSLQHYHLKMDVEVIKHTQCDENADVVLVKMGKIGHEWPPVGTINVRVGILQFFSEHPRPEICHTVAEGEFRFRRCYEHVSWARTAGIFQQPRLYPGLTSASSIHDFQLTAYHQVLADCPKPCDAQTGRLWAQLGPSIAPLSQRAGPAVAVAATIAVSATVLLGAALRWPPLLRLRQGRQASPTEYRCISGASGKTTAPEPRAGAKMTP